MNKHFENGKLVLEKLTMHGHLAYFVGGFVRDFLLEKETADIDITTSARPEEVVLLFDKVKPTGLKYGTVTVYMGKDAFEVTTFRSDGIYKNHRHPQSVTFSKTLKDDLDRRDFTINGMAMDQFGNLIDEVEGQIDLNRKMIRAIGDPFKRFEEDSLRILRAFRFVSKCDFDIEQNTFHAIQKLHPLLKNLANERIIQEFKKIILSPHWQKAMRQMLESGLTDSFPELTNGIRHLSLIGTEALDWKSFFILSFFMNERIIPENWRFSNKEKERFQIIMNLMAKTQILAFKVSDVFHSGLEICLETNRMNLLLDPDNDQSFLLKEIDKSLHIRQLNELAYTASEISQLQGLKSPSQTKKILNDLVEKVLNGKLKNEYEILKEYVKKKHIKE